MKKLVYASVFFTALFLMSCGGSESKKDITGATAGTDKPAAAGVNETDWELKDIGKTDKDFLIPPFAVKLPKDAVILKDTAGLDNTLHVMFKNGYHLMISYHSMMMNPELKLKGQIAWNRNLQIGTGNRDNEEIEMLLEDANGYVFTSQSKDKGELIGELTGHFTYLTEDKKGGYIAIEDGVSTLINNELTNVYSAANTKKIREIIAGSAAFK